MNKDFKVKLHETLNMNDSVRPNLLGKFYIKELERILSTKPKWSLRKALIGSVFIERFVILLAATKNKKVLNMKKGAYREAMKTICKNKLLVKDEIDDISDHRKKRNWILHDMVSDTGTKREIVEKKLSEMCSQARDIIKFLQKKL